MAIPTFSARNTRRLVVRCAIPRGGSLDIRADGGIGFLTDLEFVRELVPGTALDLETTVDGRITGIRVGSLWLYRKSDQRLAAEYLTGLRRGAAEDEQLLEAS